MDVQFLKQFILHPFTTGSIVPSSESLATLITDAAELGKKQDVVEFGSGTGAFTEKILQKINKHTTFFALETNPYFAKETEERCPAATVYCDSAVNARKYFQKYDIKQCDCIISGLPWASFSRDIQDTLLDTITTVLKPDGMFLSFAYLHGLLLPSGQRFKKNLHERFRDVTTTDIVWQNIPPAFVYIARK